MPRKQRPTTPRRGIPRKILERIERDAGLPGLREALGERLPSSDLQSLLLEVYRSRARQGPPRRLLDEYLRSGFLRPSPCPPAALLAWDRAVLSHLPEGFEALELSPVSPLGTTSKLAPISQDWVVSTNRGSEVVSDSSNVLALEGAVRRTALRRESAGRLSPVHLAASQRLLRAQPLSEGPGVRRHFRVFSLCSAGRDLGGLRFETEAALLHLEIYLGSLRDYLGPKVPLAVGVVPLGSGTDRQFLRENLLSPLRQRFAKVNVGWEAATPGGRAYYGHFRFHLYAKHPTLGRKEVGDGGDVDWTRRLLSDQKERMVISGIGSERLCELFPVRFPKRPRGRAPRASLIRSPPIEVRWRAPRTFAGSSRRTGPPSGNSGCGPSPRISRLLEAVLPTRQRIPSPDGKSGRREEPTATDKRPSLRRLSTIAWSEWPGSSTGKMISRSGECGSNRASGDRGSQPLCSRC